MIVWLNGAFGAGKSTVAVALRELTPGARLFDPEYVGFLLRRFVPIPTGDFQDLPLWRELVVAHLAGLAGHHPGTGTGRIGSRRSLTSPSRSALVHGKSGLLGL